MIKMPPGRSTRVISTMIASGSWGKRREQEELEVMRVYRM
jgi:hypothetical protein